MTTIVTTTGVNFTTIAADRGVTSDLVLHDRVKIVQQNSWLIAVTGTARDCDLYQYAVKYPAPPESLKQKKTEDWVGWLVLNVIPRIKAQLNPEPEKNPDYNSEAILVTHGRSFNIGSLFDVSISEPYWAIGSGSHLALGHLANFHYSENWNKNHDLMAKQSVSVASMHDPYTRGTVDLFVSHKNGKAYRA
jgi:20S proteasome alpha/beta subunit